MMRKTVLIAGTLMLGLPGVGVAQSPPPQPPAAQQPDQAQRMQRMQEMQQQMAGLMTRLRETNQWMVRENAMEQFRHMGQQMEQAGERLREMLRSMDGLHKDPALQGDRDRLREMDRLRDRLHDMQRDLDQAHDALRKMIHKP